MTSIRARHKSSWAAVLGVAASLLLAGCSSMDGVFGSSSTGPGGQQGSSSPTDRLSAIMFGPPATAPDGAAQKPDVDCPSVDIRPGAATLVVAPAATARDAGGIRYQATIARTARECALAGGSMTMRVGVQGRVVLGPTGGPGELDIPIRYAVVEEGVEPKTIDTKLHRINVAISPGQANVPFTHVAEDIIFPVSNPNALGAYVVYVGFDPEAPRVDRRRRPQTRGR